MPPEQGLGDVSIAQDVRICFEDFEKAIKSLAVAQPHVKQKIPPDGLKDELGRFRIWSGNIGAHRTGRGSLDYKLREASHVREGVLDLLRNASETLWDIRAIVIGETQPWEDRTDSISDESSDDASERGATTELSQLLSNLAEINTCLMRLSMAIRNPAPHDQFKESQKIDFASYDTVDVHYVRDKFPDAATFLVLRLGKAISRRRQYLRYREEHRNRYKRGLETLAGEGDQEDQGDGGITLQKRPGTDTSRSENLQSTIASSIRTVIKDAASVAELRAIDEFEDSFSATSYTSSTDSPITVRPPLLPQEGQHGEPFECPLCFRITSAESPKAWLKHVFRDLQPYVCTFESCDVPDHTFESRHEWYEHELQMHRGSWECLEGCNLVFASSPSLRQHLVDVHKDVVGTRRLDDIVNTCYRRAPTDFQAACALCTKKSTSSTHLMRHVGIHQEELSLFALPKHLVEVSDGSAASSIISGDLRPVLDAEMASEGAATGDQTQATVAEPGEVQHRDSQGSLRRSSTSDARVAFDGNPPGINDVSRVVEAHGGAQLLDTLGLWSTLGYDLDLGRDLTGEEVAHLRDTTLTPQFVQPLDQNVKRPFPVMDDRTHPSSTWPGDPDHASPTGASISSRGRLALFTLERPRGTNSWDLVVPERQHVSQEQLQADLREYKSLGGSAAGAISDVPSLACRRLVNELVEVENAHLESIDRTRSWVIASVQVDWRTINKTNRQMQRVHVTLELSPDTPEVAGRLSPRSSDRDRGKDETTERNTFDERAAQVVDPGDLKTPFFKMDIGEQKTLDSLLSGRVQATAEDGPAYYHNFAGAEHWQRPKLHTDQTPPAPPIVEIDEPSLGDLSSPPIQLLSESQRAAAAPYPHPVNTFKTQSGNMPPPSPPPPPPPSGPQPQSKFVPPPEPLVATNPQSLVDDAKPNVPRKSVQIVTPRQEQISPLKGILRKPTNRFPEDPEPIREGVAPHKDALKGRDIPPGARWTRIDRKLINPEALERAKERFEERMDCVIVLRVLTRDEIQKLANATREIREEREVRLNAGKENRNLGKPVIHQNAGSDVRSHTARGDSLTINSSKPRESGASASKAYRNDETHHRGLDLVESDFAYTDPASMYRDTEPAWRQPRERTARDRNRRPMTTLDNSHTYYSAYPGDLAEIRNRSSAVNVQSPTHAPTPQGLSDHRRTPTPSQQTWDRSRRDRGPPPTTRGFDKINSLEAYGSVDFAAQGNVQRQSQPHRFGEQSTYDPRFALWVLESSSEGAGSENVKPRERHVPVQDLRAEVNAFRATNLTVKGSLEEIPSSNCRRLINELVEEQSQALALKRRNWSLTWSIASINIEWRPISKRKREMKRVSIILETIPSGSFDNIDSSYPTQPESRAEKSVRVEQQLRAASHRSDASFKPQGPGPYRDPLDRVVSDHYR